MTIRLHLQDGTVKEYLPGQNAANARMKCGAPDCEHVECVLEERRARSQEMRTLASLIPLGSLILIPLLFFVVLDASFLFTAILVAGVIALGDIAGIVVFWNISRDLGRQADELREFSEKKTVNGIPARQIHETSSTK